MDFSLPHKPAVYESSYFDPHTPSFLVRSTWCSLMFIGVIVVAPVFLSNDLDLLCLGRFSRSLQLLEVAERGLALEKAAALFPGKALLALVLPVAAGLLLDFGLFLRQGRLGLGVLRLPEHVGEAELTHAVAVRDVAVRPAQLTLRLEDIVAVQVLSSTHHSDACLLPVGLRKGAQVALGEHEVALVRVVLDRPAQHHRALLELRDVLAFDEAALELELVEQVVPEVVLRQDPGIPEDDEPVLGPRQGDIQSARVVQEADAGGFVAPHTGEEDEVFLSPLETVDGGNFDLLVQLRIELTLLLHEAEDEGPLALVGSDDADLVRPQPGVEERSDGLLHVLRLDSVEEGRAGG